MTRDQQIDRLTAPFVDWQDASLDRLACAFDSMMARTGADPSHPSVAADKARITAMIEQENDQ